MQGFGIHSSIWTMRWTPEAAEKAVGEAVRNGFDFVEVALLDPAIVDATHSAKLFETSGVKAVCSLGLPEACWPSRDPQPGIDFLKVALDKTAAMGAEALTGVTYGGIGERSGEPPTERELDNVARCLEATAKHAKSLGIAFGIEPVNRYETHLINTGWQAVEMLDRVGAESLFIHLDTYHMNIEEKGAANGILAARDHLRYIHLSESDRGVPGKGTCDWDEIYATLAAIEFKGGLAMESFMNMPPEIAFGLSVWRPVADSTEEVIGEGLPFLRGKARQYGLID
ncbi:MAG: sugar phosphate isomerase/epimerase [Rhizobiales bacterium]|nr:sugar phosphate isomerase/epimerase [Hyphomicrobiales bacterium]MBO6699976.1 sugar phosphate isomerase/epimerase [Hyphomicrobiales bacterium]MBO6737859.1 sugar phosphate isomerase/epimerase [Hyphomicrobiales bacterium]MBO6913084.1 sugar phosphate isomerase/epimerase [Hyphomicrobiales bacterium]MBO6957240.1 sugar phosphate isomerase/epimerase [Hyphomicrobiales bacterium]